MWRESAEIVSAGVKVGGMRRGEPVRRPMDLSVYASALTSHSGNLTTADRTSADERGLALYGKKNREKLSECTRKNDE